MPSRTRPRSPGPSASRALSLALALVALVLPAGADDRPVLTLSTDKTFDEVLLDLEFAVTDRNLLIVARNEVGGAIRDTLEPAFPPATVVQFCNLDLARAVLARAPRLLAYLPCRVAVRVEDDRVLVSALLLPEDSGDAAADAAARRVNEVLRAVMRYAAE